MTKRKQFIVILLWIALGWVSPVNAEQARSVTTTLLPTVVSGQISQGDEQGLLWIQTRPRKRVTLEFDLSRLPGQLPTDAITRCTLRLVAREVVYKPAGNPHTGGGLVIVKARLAGDDNGESIVSLSTLSREKTVAIKASEPLRSAVEKAYLSGRPLRLELFSESRKASTLFYSDENSGNSPNQLPRLVVQYVLAPPTLLETLNWTQHQRNPEHNGRTDWRPFQPPAGFHMQTVPLPQIDGRTPAVVDYPLIYQGTLFLVAKVLETNHIMALTPMGSMLWSRDMGEGTVQRPPVISPSGRYYVVLENEIAAFDLMDRGRRAAAFDLSRIACPGGAGPAKLSDYTDPVIGRDGSLLASIKACDNNYIYAFTPDLKPVMAFGPFGAGQMKISTSCMSPDGATLYAQAPQGGVAIDVIDPSQAKIILLKKASTVPFGYYHTPLAGPTSGSVVFTDFSDTDYRGNVWGYGPNQMNWLSGGNLASQPVLGANRVTYFVQDQHLKGYKFDNTNPQCIDEALPGPDPKTTSNLVMDGGDNLYFWNNGYFNGCNADGKPLFAPIDMTGTSFKLNVAEAGHLTGPEQFIRLMLAPDGTLWANNKNGNALFAFRPDYAAANVHLEQPDIQDRTVYRTSGTLTAGPVTLAASTQTILQARESISLSSGFSVDKGASLLCRTGF